MDIDMRTYVDAPIPSSGFGSVEGKMPDERKYKMLNYYTVSIFLILLGLYNQSVVPFSILAIMLIVNTSVKLIQKIGKKSPEIVEEVKKPRKKYDPNEEFIISGSCVSNVRQFHKPYSGTKRGTDYVYDPDRVYVRGHWRKRA